MLCKLSFVYKSILLPPSQSKSKHVMLSFNQSGKGLKHYIRDTGDPVGWLYT